MLTIADENAAKFDKISRALRILVMGFERAAIEKMGSDLKVLGLDDGSGNYEIQILDDGNLRTRTFWFGVGDPDDEDGEIVEYTIGRYDIELGLRTTSPQWADYSGLLEAFVRWLTDESSEA